MNERLVETMSRLTDTSPEAERVLVEVLRRLPMAVKWRQMGQLFHTAKALHAAGERWRNPRATAAEIHQAWLAKVLEPALLSSSRSLDMSVADDNWRVLHEVARVLDRLGIPFALGGSWASSLHGQPRLTQDAVVIVEPFAGREDEFCRGFGAEHYLSPEAVRDANQRRSSFNIIQFAVGFKVDVFVRKEQEFARSVMARRRVVHVGGIDMPVVSPEDIILLKLDRYRLGNEMANHQWSDILGVLKVQAGRLDEAYLDRWAAELQVAVLLERARQDSNPR